MHVLIAYYYSNLVAERSIAISLSVCVCVCQWPSTTVHCQSFPAVFVVVVCYSVLVGERSIAISLSVCLCMCVCMSVHELELLDRSSQNFLCRSRLAVALSSSGSVAIRYVLPVLWMTSCLAVVGHMVMRGPLNLILLLLVALRYRGTVWCLWMPCCESICNELSV